MTKEPTGLNQRVAKLERELALVRMQLRGMEHRLSAQAGRVLPEVTDPATELSGAGSPEQATTGAAEPGGGQGTGLPQAVGSAAPGDPWDGFEWAGADAPPTAPPTASPVFSGALEGAVGGRSPRGQGGSETRSLERKIGGQVFAVAGALIIIIGLGLAMKLAIDNQWFRYFPPVVRCLGIAALGAAFLGVGEFARTRIRPIAVAGCNAVGLAGLYIAAYAAFGVFHLIAAPVAFTLMALAAGVGLAVALRHGFLSTGLVSLAGAYLVPVLLAQPDASPHILPVYVLLLSAVALSLAASRPRPFGAMRDAAWLGAGLLGLAWTLATLDDHPWLVLVFWAVAWALHQSELLVTASRDQLRPEAVTGAALGDPHRFRRRIEPVLLAITTSAGVVGLAAVILKHHLGLEPWLAPAAGLAVTGVLALVYGGHLRVLRDMPRTDLEALAAAHAAQAGALLATTVALACSGWVEATAWLAMGVAAVLAGRWIAARSLEAYGVVLLVIATARISTYDLFVGGAGTPWTVDAPLALAPWTVLMIAAGWAWMLVAKLMLHASRDEEGDLAARPRTAAPVVCAALGVGAWMFAPAHPESAAAAVCLAWLVLSIVLRGVARFEPRLWLGEMGMVAAGGAIVPWVVASDMEHWAGSTVPVGTHPGLWLAATIAAFLCGHAWAARRWDTPTDLGSPWPPLASLAAGIMFVATSFEVVRIAAILAADDTVRGAALSIWWGLWGVSAVVVGFWRRVGPVRYGGVALLSVAAAKAVVLDLAGVSGLWRVASFVGLGGLMLGVAVLYGRVSASLGGEQLEGAGSGEGAG